METRQVWDTQFIERYRHVNQIVVKFTTEAGLNYAHGFTEEYPSFIAAAFDVNMAEGGMDEILDFILHQPHIPDPHDPANVETDVAAKQGLTATVVNHRDYAPGTVVPVTALTAKNSQQAREAMLLRIAEVKKTIQYVPYTEVPTADLRSHAAQLFHMTEGELPHPYQSFRDLPIVTEESIAKQNEHLDLARLAMLGLAVPGRGRVPGVEKPVRKNDGTVRQSLAIYLNPVQGNPLRTK